jgi:myo-inositol catabolism protein IolC
MPNPTLSSLLVIVSGSLVDGGWSRGFIGFAVGRTSFWDPLVNWRAKKITQEDAVNETVRRYREFVATFEEKVRAARS